MVALTFHDNGKLLFQKGLCGMVRSSASNPLPPIVGDATRQDVGRGQAASAADEGCQDADQGCALRAPARGEARRCAERGEGRQLGAAVGAGAEQCQHDEEGACTVHSTFSVTAMVSGTLPLAL